jgi:hypothetical protein
VQADPRVQEVYLGTAGHALAAGADAVEAIATVAEQVAEQVAQEVEATDALTPAAVEGTAR